MFRRIIAMVMAGIMSATLMGQTKKTVPRMKKMGQPGVTVKGKIVNRTREKVVNRTREQPFVRTREQSADRENTTRQEDSLMEKQRFWESDEGNIWRRVKAGFGRWSEIGEFEKRSDYDKRLREKSAAVFDSICAEAVEWRIKDQSERWTLSMGTYDAEREFFPFKAYFGGNETVIHYHVPIKDAPRFKQLFAENNYWHGVWDDPVFVNHDIVAMSRLITPTDVLKLSFTDARPLAIRFADLQIDNPYLSDHVFTYGEVAVANDSIGIDPNDQTVYQQVDITPRMYGLMRRDRMYGLGRWLKDNMRYPVRAQENGKQGKVVGSAILEKDGTLSDIKVEEPVDEDLDNEVLRLLRAMPRWRPAMQNGKYVRVRITLPVVFRLGQ